MKNFIKCLFLLVPLNLILYKSISAQCYNLWYSSANAVRHWTTSSVMFYVNVNGSRFFSSPHTVEANAIGRAFASWQNVEPATISFVYGGFDNATNANDNKSVLYWNNDINVSAYVIASLTTYGNNYTGVLTNVDIWFNDRYYEWTDGTLVFDSKIMDIQSIATHEIGHFLGLNESDPCMDNAPTMMTAPLWEAYFKSEAESPNLGIRNLAQGDMDGLNYLYGATLRVPQIFTTIEQAISFAQSGQTILVSNGNYSISNNLIISNGVVLQVNPGVTLNFAIGASLIVNGTLNAVGNSTNRITFTRSGTSGTWGGIKFNSGSSGSVQYCDISYANYGIHLYNSPSNIVINNNTITNGNVGIYCQQTTSTLLRNIITGQSSYGLSSFDSDVYLTYNGQGNNVIRNNNYGVQSGYESVTYISNGNNCVHNNTNQEVYALMYSLVNAENTWWNHTEYPYWTQADFWIQYYSTVDADPNNLRSDPNNCPLMKTSNLSSNGMISSGPAIDKEIIEILEKEKEGRYEEAIRNYKEKLKENKPRAKRDLYLAD